MIDVEKTMPVYVAWVNSDLTEGRGFQRPLFVSESKAAVKRLGKGQNVQGTDAEVTLETAVKIKGRWCAPVEFVNPNQADLLEDEKEDKRDRALKRAKALGMTDGEIEALRS